jgi:hypothetical protein
MERVCFSSALGCDQSQRPGEQQVYDLIAKRAAPQPPWHTRLAQVEDLELCASYIGATCGSIDSRDS